MKQQEILTDAWHKWEIAQMGAYLAYGLVRIEDLIKNLTPDLKLTKEQFESIKRKSELTLQTLEELDKEVFNLKYKKEDCLCEDK